MSLAYVLIVFNYNKHPHTSFISNENLKMFFIRVLKDRAFFFFRRRKCRNDPPMVFFFRGASEIKFLNLFLLPVTRCDFGPCLVTQSFFLVFDLHAPIRHPHPFSFVTHPISFCSTFTPSIRMIERDTYIFRVGATFRLLHTSKLHLNFPV